MYGDLVLIEESGKLLRSERAYLKELKGKDEAWLRDTLFNNPAMVPVSDIDSAFAPLIPLCKELRTDAGLIDATFINERGLLTIVECKLWKNPQARREVVAQTLHYVSALTRWTYADLQRQVSAALGRRGNVLFELVQTHTSNKMREQEFVDAAGRHLREGRILVLIAGEGIRESVQSLAELINRSAAKAFSFGLIEVALYSFGKRRLAIQPRVLARTETITRHVTVMDGKLERSFAVENESLDVAAPSIRASTGDKEHLRRWWQPILDMRFDDPEQDAPRWLTTNNVALSTPFPGIQIKAWAAVDGGQMGVYVMGVRTGHVEAIIDFIKRDRKYLLDRLPRGTVVDLDNTWPIILKNTTILPDRERYAWLKATINSFVNVMRPQLRKWYEELNANQGTTKDGP